jgi:hypothetical protein
MWTSIPECPTNSSSIQPYRDTQALLTRWADDSAARPDTGAYFHVAQEYFELFFRDPLDQRSSHEQHLAQQLWLIIVEVWLDAEQPPAVGLSRGQLTAVYRFVTHIHLYSPFESSQSQHHAPSHFNYAKLVFDMQGPM